MKTVFGRILQKNNSQFFDCVHKENVNCGEGVLIEGIYWFVPQTKRGRVVSYKPEISSTKPSADAVHALRVRDTLTNSVYYLALADAADAGDFSDICNACCDATSNLMPDVVVPTALLEEDACGNATDGFTYFDVPPAITGTEVYYPIGSLEGVAFTGQQAAGHASLAAFVTWANANWSAYGTWAQASGKVTLTSANKVTGFIKLLKAKPFDSNVPAALGAGQNYVANATVDGVVLPTLTGANDAALTTVATAANADAQWAIHGSWAVVGGALRLVSPTATTVSIIITIIA